MGKKMKNAPVYFTIGQIQHNPILNLSGYVTAIQERLRKAGYPDFKQAVQMQFDLSAAQVPQPAVQRVERFLISDIAGTSGFSFQANAISFQTTEYETFDAFQRQLRLGLDVLDEVVGGLAFVERIGLRYLDVVAPRPGERVGQYLANEVAGLRARMPESTFAYSFSEAMLIDGEGSQVVSRTIIQSGSLSFPPDLQPESLTVAERFGAVSGEHAVIDSDGSFSIRQRFDPQFVEAKLKALHDLIDKSFRETASDHARTVWGAEGASE
jgi:uncharacterized protein (TIGR04255 family)